MKARIEGGDRVVCGRGQGRDSRREVEDDPVLAGGARVAVSAKRKKSWGAAESSRAGCASVGGEKKWARPSWGGERGSGCGLLKFFSDKTLFFF